LGAVIRVARWSNSDDAHLKPTIRTIVKHNGRLGRKDLPSVPLCLLGEWEKIWKMLKI
jgi:hypothetical protein